MTPHDFNIQQALTDMEERLRTDIRAAGERADAAAAAAIKKASEAAEDGIALDGRVKNLEEKAGWIGAGFGAMVVAAAGFIWHIIMGKG